MYYYQVNEVTNGPLSRKRYLAKRMIVNLSEYHHADIFLLDEKMRKIEKYDSEVKCWVMINGS